MLVKKIESFTLYNHLYMPSHKQLVRGKLLKGITRDIVTLDHKGGLHIVGTQFIHDNIKDPIVMYDVPVPTSTELAIKRLREHDFIVIVLIKIHPDYLNILHKNALDFKTIKEIPAELSELIIQLGEDCTKMGIHLNEGFDFEMFEQSYKIVQSKLSTPKLETQVTLKNTAENITAFLSTLSEANLSIEKMKALNKVFVAANILLGSTAPLQKTPNNIEELSSKVSENIESFIALFNQHKDTNTNNLSASCKYLDTLLDTANQVLDGKNIFSINPADYKKWAIRIGQKRG